MNPLITTLYFCVGFLFLLLGFGSLEKATRAPVPVIVVSESAQVAPRPLLSGGRNAIVILRRTKSDGTYQLENWEPFINSAGMTDMHLTHTSIGRINESSEN